jgi:hypothetical protein
MRAIQKKYTITEAAKFLGVSRAAIQLAVKEKRLPGKWDTRTADVLLIDVRDLKSYQVKHRKAARMRWYHCFSDATRFW